MINPNHVLPLSFADIADAISQTVKKRIGVSYLRRKLNRSTRMLERALDLMKRQGLVKFYPEDRTYALTGAPIPKVIVQPYTRVAEAFARPAPPPPAAKEDDAFDEDIDTLPALERAERIWRERMGTRRWRDDPRAAAEPWHPENMRAPF